MLTKLGRIVFISVIVLAGVWLLSRASRPAPESAARQDAVRLALAPAAAQRPGGPLNAEALPEVVVANAVSVELGRVPSGVRDNNSQLDRWRRGEIDLNETDGLRSRAELARMRADSMRLQPGGRVQLADAGPSLNAPTLGTGWDSLDYNDCCGGGGNVPPDPEIAVGPNHVIAVVNVAFEIYNRAGEVLKPATTFASFFASNANCNGSGTYGVFDPNVVYDESADRYLLGIDSNGKYYCAAVSQKGDPMGAWNVYAFPTASGNEFFDYPHIGVGRDAFYMGANIFAGSRFKVARVYAFDKNQMYAGTTASAVNKGLPISEDTPQPLHLHGWAQGTWPTSGPHSFLTETNYNGNTYSVWNWSNPFSGTSPTLAGTVNISSYTGVSAGLPVDQPQSGGQTLDAGDYRPQDFEYRDGFGWTSNTIACNPGGGTTNCIRWAKINLSNATIADAGVYASNGQYRSYADLAVNDCGDMAIGYTKMSSSSFPAVFYTGRRAGDAPGSLQAEAQLKAGDITYTSFESSAPRRWGDYTEMTISPDGDTFYYLGEYSKNTGTSDGRWGTYIGAFSFGACGGVGPTPTPIAPTATPVPPTPTATPAASGQLHVGNLASSSQYTNDGRRWEATAIVTAVDASNAPVSGVTVSGTWSNGASGSGTCTTNTSGVCSIVKGGLRTNTSSVRFSVTNLVKASYTYNAAANTATNITINRP